MSAVPQAMILPAAGEGARVPTVGSTTQRLVEDVQIGLVAGVLRAPPADSRLTSAALFVDQNAQQLGPVAALKHYPYPNTCMTCSRSVRLTACSDALLAWYMRPCVCLDVPVA